MLVGSSLTITCQVDVLPSQVIWVRSSISSGTIENIYDNGNNYMTPRLTVSNTQLLINNIYTNLDFTSVTQEDGDYIYYCYTLAESFPGSTYNPFDSAYLVAYTTTTTTTTTSTKTTTTFTKTTTTTITTTTSTTTTTQETIYTSSSSTSSKTTGFITFPTSSSKTTLSTIVYRTTGTISKKTSSATKTRVSVRTTRSTKATITTRTTRC